MSRQILTPDEARNAIYIDFEGFENKTPSLLGVFDGESPDPTKPAVRQSVLDEGLRVVAAKSGLPVMFLAEAIGPLIDEAGTTRRRIVSFSSAERSIVARYLGTDVLSEFDDVFFNSLPFLTHWVNALHTDWKFPKSQNPRGSRYTLARFMRHAGYKRPHGAGSGRATAKITQVRSGLRRAGTYEGLTRNQKQMWGYLLLHNAHDVLGMRTLCVLAADEFAERDARRRGRRQPDPDG